MKIRITTNYYNGFAAKKDTIWPVLAVYHKEDGNTLYLIDVPLGAAYHYNRAKNYLITSENYSSAKHMNSDYGWIRKNYAEVIDDGKSNQDFTWRLRRGD